MWRVMQSEDMKKPMAARWLAERGVAPQRRPQSRAMSRAEPREAVDALPEDGAPAAAETRSTLDAPQGANSAQDASPSDNHTTVHSPSHLSANVPIIDLATILRIVWDHRKMVAIAVVVCAIALGAATLLLGKKYGATAVIYFDPTQIRVTDENDKNSSPSPQVISAIIDSQSMIIMSDNVLLTVVDQLHLDKDAEFTPSKSVEGMDDRHLAARTLQSAILVKREDNTYVTSVKVISSDAVKASTIANAVVSAFKDEMNAMALEKYTTANSALSSRLTELGQAAQQVEREVEDYRSQNDLVEAGGDLISDKRLTSLNELLVQAQKTTISAKAKYDAATRVDVNDIVSGAMVDDVGSRTLGDLRSEYSKQSSIVESLASNLGARHPSLLAAQASLDAIKGQIRNELGRVGASAKDQYQQALNAENAIKKELTVQKALQSTSSPETVKLKELERKATVTSEIYSTALKRATEIHEEQNLLQSNIRIISAAVPPLKADGPGRVVLMIAGLFGGSILGLGIGALLALFIEFSGLIGKPFSRTQRADLDGTA